MTRTGALAVAVMVFTGAADVSGVRPPDRSTVLTALEQRALTGVPRHFDHDEGQDLQDAVTTALAAHPNDSEMAWAALRASFPIVPRASCIICESTPSLGIAVASRLALPWKATAKTSIDGSLDGSDWHRVIDPSIDLPIASALSIPLEKLFPHAGSPGFHVVRLRATIEFAGQPGSMPAGDTREVSPVTYGVTGRSADGERVAALLNAAGRASASDFDGTLPHVPFDTWLSTIAATPGSPPIFWHASWCEDRTGPDEGRSDEERLASICARAMAGSSPDGGHAEVWVKVATVEMTGPTPTWAIVPPTLDAVDLVSGIARSSGTLAMLPWALRANVNQWPHAELALDPQGIVVSPAAPKPGEPVTIAIEVRNTGTSDLLGTEIDVVVGDATEGPALAHRLFVRPIPAGDSVIVKTDARFPHGYAVVSVLAMAGSHSAVSGALPPLLNDPWDSSRAAWRVVRPELAPPGFVAQMGAAIGCKPNCGIGR